MKEKDLILLRGLPGSGKTTVGMLITPLILSADDYFTDDQGTYNFDVTKLNSAHESCFNRCEHLMSQYVNRIVVANTFTQKWEMETYIQLAKKHSYRVHTLIVENRHESTNVHNVPEETLKKMKDRFEIEL